MELYRSIKRQYQRVRQFCAARLPITHGYLRRNLKGLTPNKDDRQFSRLGGMPEWRGPVLRFQLRDYLREADLFLQEACSAVAEQYSNEAYEEEVSFRVFIGNTQTFEMPSCLPEVHKLTLYNQNSRSLTGLFLNVNGRDVKSLDGLVANLRERARSSSQGKISDKQMALEVYHFCRQQHTHASRPTRSRNNISVIDPMRYFFWYGYGLCGYCANALATLCASAGLKSRVWNIRGHTFPEVFLNNQWRILDADLEVWFPGECGPVSLAELSRDPQSWFQNLRLSEWYEPIKEQLAVRYRKTGRHRVVSKGEDLLAEVRRQPYKRRGLTIVPTEELEIDYRPTGHWCSGHGFLSGGIPQGRGAIISRVELVKAAAFGGISNLQPVFSISGGELCKSTEIGSDMLFFNASGQIQYHPLLDFPLVDVTISIEQSPTQGSGEDFHVFFCSKHREKVQLLPICSPDGRFTYRLRRVLADRRQTEHCEVDIFFVGDTICKSIWFTAEFQTSSFLLPELHPGQNSISPEGTTEDLELFVGIRFNKSDYIVEEEALTPIWPPNREKVPLNKLHKISWVPSVKFPEQGPFWEFMLRRARGDFVDVSPNFDRLLCRSEFVLTEKERGFLEMGEEYLWRVRIVSSRGKPLINWSKSFYFTIDELKL